MSKSERLSEILRKGGIPHKRAEAFGSHVIVTLWGEEAADRTARALKAAGFEVKGPKRAVETNEENRGTVLCPTIHKVWRVWAVAR